MLNTLPLALLLCLAQAQRTGSGTFEPWLLEHWSRHAKSGLDLRVTKGLGLKGYSRVRISLISQGPVDVLDFNFSYRQHFRYRWRDNYLQSALVDLKDGENEIIIQGRKVVVDLPKKGKGVRGVVLSDPCFSSKWVRCAYSERFQTFAHSTTLLNAAFADGNMNFFAMLGDNFYDQTGELTKTFWQELSADVKRRFLLVVNGNHDNWVCGDPRCGDAFDNFGIGQMQFYAMDSAASLRHDLFSFSVDPDQRRQWGSFQNSQENFLAYHLLGNLGFLTFTGAASFDESAGHFERACAFFAEARPAAVFLLGHWNHKGLGASGNMTAPAVREALLRFPGCRSFKERLKFMDGHKHCNFVQKSSVGFMIGGHGMDQAECEAQYGFLYVDSTEGRVSLHYFEVDSESRGSRYQEILQCLGSRGGLHGCTHLAETWLNEPVPVGQELLV